MKWLLILFVIYEIIYVLVYSIKENAFRKYFGSNQSITLSEINNMDGHTFEKYCADQLKKSGKFKSIEVTPSSGDFGADIIAKEKSGTIWVYQCKRYTSKLDNTSIQEVVAAKAHYGATRAGVITNSEFTNADRQLAVDNCVELIEGNKFIALTRF